MKGYTRRIVWAVDPFESDLTLDAGTIKDLKQWTEKKKIEIEPVCMLKQSDPSFNLRDQVTLVYRETSSGGSSNKLRSTVRIGSDERNSISKS